ncbi:hypothetical protein [Antarctobacter sp.]
MSRSVIDEVMTTAPNAILLIASTPVAAITDIATRCPDYHPRA